VAVSSGYSFSTSDHYLSAISGGDIIATSAALTSTDPTDGNASADPVVFSSVGAGSTIAGLWLYRDTGSSSTSQLLVWWDQDATNFPLAIVTNGGDITLTFPSGGTLFIL